MAEHALLAELPARRAGGDEGLGLHWRYRAIEASPNAMAITSAASPDFLIEYVNPAFERITGYTSQETVGRNCKFLQGEDRDQPGLQAIRLALREHRCGNAVLRNYRKDGSMFWNHLHVAPVTDGDGHVTHFVASQYDLTEVKNHEASLQYQATHDALTGLANRSMLKDRLNQAVAAADRYKRCLWVVFIDLDHFKAINDSFGHGIGDEFLKIIAARLQDSVREIDTVARLGGDEFVIILPEQSAGNLTTVALQRLVDTVTAPIEFRRQTFCLTCSMGVAIYPHDGGSANALLERADIAMYEAKARGRNNFQFHTMDINSAATERLVAENDLRHALEREEFILHYQPQVDLVTGQLAGMEALIRWRHPTRGMVSPAEFIKLAEETGLIVPIGAWVIRTACAQNRAWHDAGYPNLRVAVNLSARQFEHNSIVAVVAAALADSGLAATQLDIELTESLVMHNVDQAIAIMRSLKDLGVSLSLDDFGTGYSSLSHLKRFPIDVLKIDQSFVADIVRDADGAAIVMSIISLAHNLKLHVIAEGVETLEQLAYLRRHDCDEIQGYYFSRPLAVEAFGELLAANKCLPPQGDGAVEASAS
ncbi:MAG: putative bifunctional diguanylate cyclase/phosphodiesterase [Janthinobacterium lividum]